MKKIVLGLLACASTLVFAQEKPAYSIAEISFLNQKGYQNELWPKIQKLVNDAGAEIIVSGGKSEAVVGMLKMPDKITVIKFKNFQSAKDFYVSQPYQNLKPLADQYVKIKLYIVEGQ